MTSIEEFFAHNATYILTTVGTVMSAFSLVQYRTGQLEQRMSRIVETFEGSLKDADVKFVRQDTFKALEQRLDRMESKIDRLIERRSA